jgi:hypothetical protein
MTMYDQYFDRRESYTTTEVLRRAYALGVASVCGDPDDGAYDRLKERSPDTYDRSIVELAYEEGRAEALELEATAETREEIWNRLVETTLDPGTTDGADLPKGLPDLLSRGKGEEASPAAGPPERLDLPSFLRR